MRTDAMQSIKTHKFKILIGLIILILFSLIFYGIYLYQQINDLETVDYQATESQINQELSLSSIKEISRFHGTSYYHIVEAETMEQEAIIIFVNQTDESDDLMFFSKEDLYPKNDLLDKWEEQTDYEEVYETQYGIREGIPLVEIIYLDHNQRLSYDYYRLDNGEFDNGISFANK